jgi:hypothetical protein
MKIFVDALRTLQQFHGSESGQDIMEYAISAL